MARAVLLLVLLAVTGIAIAMVWQHRRYLDARRHAVQDHQPLLHSGEVFHVVTFLELEPGAELLASVRHFRDVLEATGDAKVVYAGKVAVNALASAQLVEVFGEAVPWDAIVCTQLEERDAWARLGERGEWKRALDGFARSYSHGMERSALQNLLLPQALLAERARQIVTRAPSGLPFEPAPVEEMSMRDTSPIAQLAAHRDLGRDAIMIVNLVLPGTAEDQEADRAYTRRMIALMAEVGNGPMHMGRAVTLERDTRFERIALVYYPGVDYFARMATSRFYQGIVGDKQLGDTQASITVPILDRL